MGHNRSEVENSIRNQFDWVVFDGEYSLPSIIIEAVADWYTGGQVEDLPIGTATHAAQQFGINLAQATAQNGFNPATDVIYGGTMTFQNWQDLPGGLQLPLPNKFVPYFAVKKAGGQHPPPAQPPKLHNKLFHVANNSGVDIEIDLQYFAHKINVVAWYPNGASQFDESHVLPYHIINGQGTYLNDSGWVISAQVVKFWAKGLSSGKKWNQHWGTTPLHLVDSEGYVGTHDASYFYTFNP